ncbi:hypothetical protein PSEUDO8O_30106 [Pseudomonas sp. 8O]|nr:hypothetical protein PSEUDO8O_30106 [Pseudomonas sp. 8O]
MCVDKSSHIVFKYLFLFDLYVIYAGMLQVFSVTKLHENGACDGENAPNLHTIFKR